MLTLTLPTALPLPCLPSLPSLPPWLRQRMDLRIDVQVRPDALHADLADIHRRLNTPGDALYGIPEIGSPGPGLVFRYREADGEHYVYVEDVVRRQLAGYTVFNRLMEVGRRADPHLRAPHSKYALAYQRRGLATAVYEWGLGAGICLMSGARQSSGAHGLWRALSRRDQARPMPEPARQRPPDHGHGSHAQRLGHAGQLGCAPRHLCAVCRPPLSGQHP